MLYQLSYFRKYPLFVKEMRLELTRHNCHHPLKVARLPIPPFLQKRKSRAIVPRTGLEPACLSTHAPETCASTNSATWAIIKSKKRAENETRTRDPNLGKVMLYQLSYFRITSTTVHHFPDCECKGNLFFETTKIIDYLFLKKVTNFFGLTAPIKVSAYPFSS